MKKIDDTVITVFKQLQSVLKPKDFRRHIEITLPEYEVTTEFIKIFLDTLDMSVVCKQSLTPECIKYLCDTDKFDLTSWLVNIENKNIDILADDDFIKKYPSIDVNDILARSNNISDIIFNKFCNNCSESAFRNIILNCNASNLTIEFIASNINKIGLGVFKMKIVKNDLKNTNSIIEKEILSSGKTINILLLIELMVNLYDPEAIRKCKDNLLFDAPEIIDMTVLQENLNNIIQKYPTDIVEFILTETNKNIPLALLDRTLLLMFLTSHDYISEDCLTDLHEVFVQTGVRDSLVNYCKNHEYKNCLIALKLRGEA